MLPVLRRGCEVTRYRRPGDSGVDKLVSRDNRVHEVELWQAELSNGARRTCAGRMSPLGRRRSKPCAASVTRRASLIESSVTQADQAAAAVPAARPLRSAPATPPRPERAPSPGGPRLRGRGPRAAW